MAVAWRNVQPASVPLTRQKLQRDASAAVDRVVLYVDFDGDGREGYSFTVSLSGSVADATISNENSTNSDWDGDWTASTAEFDGGWSAEVLIPWHIAPMKSGDGKMREIGVAIERVVGATNEKMVWPAIDIAETPFLSSTNKIEVMRHESGHLAIVPYVVGTYDNITGKSDFDAGADLFWKPSGRFQLSATLNPDFGQVESDELVVNFSTIETFFSDKRPFFTENQSFFDVPFGSADGTSRLIYTRRVGATRDDGDGPGDVTGAIKLNGRIGDLGYGVFYADESGAPGREFVAARVARDGARGGWGGMAMRVERPLLDRVADVYAFDARWRPFDRVNLSGVAVVSQVSQEGRGSRDLGGQIQVEHEIDDNWRQRLFLLSIGERLELDDFGFLERHDLDHARYELTHRVTDMQDRPGWAWHRWRFIADMQRNRSGLRLKDSLGLGRYSERLDGRVHSWEVSAGSRGYDDLVTRGNGAIRVPRRYSASYEYYRPRPADGSLAFYGDARYRSSGLGGFGKGRYRLYLDPVYHVSDSLRLFAGLKIEHDNDALLWRQDDNGDGRLATYAMDTLTFSSGVTWLFKDRHELRVRLESIGLEASAKRALSYDDSGRVGPSGEQVEDFALRQLGFQVRYRYEFAPLSHLYIAYVRGGSLIDTAEGRGHGAEHQLADAFSLRDNEQLLIKLSYRFAR